MIIDMPAITTTEVEAKLVDLKQSGNAVALGRVLTLVILNDEAIPVQGGAEVELDPSDLGAACCAMPEPGHVHDAVTGASVDGSSADNGSVDTASDGAGTGKRLLVRRARQGAGTPGHSAEGENANPDFAVHVDAEAAIHAANQASREHPARI
ncbi:MAG: hypothetical protein LBB58_02355, partial [Cellulomonadaceae bacterium]|nr:hypothetical protein [Cellulomonadaceae bacterium]